MEKIKAIRLYANDEFAQVFIEGDDGVEYELIRDHGETIDHWVNLENLDLSSLNSRPLLESTITTKDLLVADETIVKTKKKENCGCYPGSPSNDWSTLTSEKHLASLSKNPEKK